MSDETEVRIVNLSEVPVSTRRPYHGRYSDVYKALAAGKAARVTCRNNEDVRRLQTNIHSSLCKKIGGQFVTQCDHEHNCVWVIPKEAKATR